MMTRKISFIYKNSIMAEMIGIVANLNNINNVNNVDKIESEIIASIDWSQLSFWMLIIVAIFIVVIVIIILLIVDDTKKLIGGVVEAVEGNIGGSFDLDQATHPIIAYQQPLPVRLPGVPFDLDFGLFLSRTVMSTINVALETDPLLPSDLKLIRKVGTFALFLKRINSPLYILSFRGTITSSDLAKDLLASQTQFVGFDNQTVQGAQVHKGFNEVWTDLKPELKQILDQLSQESNAQLIITGHSLGSGLAALTTAGYVLEKPPFDFGMYLFASPRVGNRNFMNIIEKNVPIRWAIANYTDIIPDLPPGAYFTLENTWLYDVLDHQITTDVQTGTPQFNHFVSTYLCSLDLQAPECPAPIIWSSPPGMVVPLIL